MGGEIFLLCIARDGQIARFDISKFDLVACIGLKGKSCLSARTRKVS